MYHAIGLLADAARGLRSEVRDELPSVNWVGLFAMRAILVHRPWLVASDIVLSAASRDVYAGPIVEVQQYVEGQRNHSIGYRLSQAMTVSQQGLAMIDASLLRFAKLGTGDGE